MNKEELSKIIDDLYLKSKEAYDNNEIPVSACLVLNDGRIFFDRNRVEENDDPFSHAEYEVINKALKETEGRYLKDSILIVTLEPCLFCMGALLKAGIKTLYYILPDTKLGSLSHYHAFVDDKLEVIEIEDKRFASLMDSFFKNIRKKN